jgi:hypothetical protein
MSRQLQQGPGGGLWCRDHKCYHTASLDLTQNIVLIVIRDRFKLTTRQAERYGLEINDDTVFIPKRDRRVPGGWVTVRFHWRMDGQQLRLEPPNETAQSSLN